MVENKNGKALIWVCVILSVLVVCLGGFILYKEVLTKEETLPKKEEQTNNSTISIEDYPKSHSNGIKTHSIFDTLFDEEDNVENFKNDTVTLDGVKFDVECSSSYEELGKKVCETISIKLANGNKAEISELSLYGDAIDMIIYDDYIIVQSGIGYHSSGLIKIYTKDGSFIKSIGGTVKAYAPEKGSDLIETDMRLVDDKLYFVKGLKLEDGKNVDLSLKYIDFKNGLNEVTSDTFSGVVYDYE